MRVLRVAVPDRIIPHGPPDLLHAKYGLDADGIFQRVKKFLDECRSQKLDSTSYSSRPDSLKVVKKPRL